MKYSLEDVRKEYDRLDVLCGVDTSGIQLVISKRLKNHTGKLEYEDNKPTKIKIAGFIFDREDDIGFWDAVRKIYASVLVRFRHPNETISVEMLHNAFREIGCEPMGHYNSPFTTDETQAKYIIECVRCQKRVMYTRPDSLIKMLKSGEPVLCFCPDCHTPTIRLIEK